MAKTIQGQLIAKGKKFGIIASRFNDFITNRLLEGCMDTLLRHGAKENDMEVAWVPGSFEIPVLAHRMAKSKKYDAVICLGTVIRGSTPHGRKAMTICVHACGAKRRRPYGGRSRTWLRCQAG